MGFIDGIKVSGVNTGVGNVMSNKGGIVVSLEYQRTRFTFLSAHLAAHEGQSYYNSRCNNIHDILRYSQTFELSKIIDLSVSSHHMFILGDLNFRTKIELKDIEEYKSKPINGAVTKGTGIFRSLVERISEKE